MIKMIMMSGFVDLAGDSSDDEDEQPRLGDGGRARASALLDLTAHGGGEGETRLGSIDRLLAAPFPRSQAPMSREAHARVLDVLDGTADMDAVVAFGLGGVPLTRESLLCLREGRWLNDEAINAYMCALERTYASTGRAFLNTFFYTHFIADGFGAVSRDLVRRGLSLLDPSLRYLIVPVHHGAHWLVAMLQLRHQRVVVFDSLPNAEVAATVAENLKRWVALETQRAVAANEGSVCSRADIAPLLNAASWAVQTSAGDIPQQPNGTDCGVYACYFANCMARRRMPKFCQAFVPYMRARILHDILQLPAQA